MNLDPKQQRKLEKIKNVVKHGDLGIIALLLSSAIITMSIR